MLLAHDLEKVIEIVQVLPERSYVTAPSPGAAVTSMVIGVDGKPAFCEPATEAVVTAAVLRVAVHQRKDVPWLLRQPSAAEQTQPIDSPKVGLGSTHHCHSASP